MQRLTPLFLAGFLIVFLHSCKKDFELNTDNWQPEAATALFHSSVSLEDLLSNFETGGFLQTNPDNSLTIIHETQLFSTEGEDLIEIQDLTIPIIGDSLLVVNPADLDTEHTLKKFSLKEGRFVYTLQSPYPENINVTMEITNMTGRR